MSVIIKVLLFISLSFVITTIYLSEPVKDIAYEASLAIQPIIVITLFIVLPVRAFIINRRRKIKLYRRLPQHGSTAYI